MANLRHLLQTYVDNGAVPGAVALVARGEDVEVEAVGFADVEGSAPMARDSIFRLASMTKPITAAALMMLIDEGRIALDDPVERWLPELAAPVVVRTPSGPVDDVVPAARAITVFDLLSFHAGYGFPSDFSLPAVQLWLSEAHIFGRDQESMPTPDEWMDRLSRIPLLYQPGEAWLYNAGSDIQGVLIARVSGRSLPEFLAERVFEPLGMTDTGFAVPAEKLDRFTSFYQTDSAGHLELLDAPGGQWSSLSVFPSGAGGLVSTVDDWYAFARMILAGGSVDGRRLLSVESVQKMTTDYMTQPQRDASWVFLEGQGWGFGGSVDIAAIDAWNVPGRYGWIGGTGTAGHIVPSTGAVTILLSQLQMTGPTPTPMMRDFWRYAAAA